MRRPNQTGKKKDSVPSVSWFGLFVETTASAQQQNSLASFLCRIFSLFELKYPQKKYCISYDDGGGGGSFGHLFLG